MSTIDYNGRSVASCRVAEVTGAFAAGRYVLGLRLALTVFDFKRHNASPGALVYWAGELDTPAGKCWVRPSFDLVGLQEQTRDLHLESDLDHAQARLIDEARLGAGGDLQLTLHLRCLLSVTGQSAFPIYARVDAPINQSQWLSFLSSSGFEERQAVDLSLVVKGQSEELACAAKELKIAWESYRKRDWRSVLTNCRRSFEHMPQCGKPQALNEDWDLASRIRNAHAAVRAVLHAGAHTGIGEPNREEARLVLTMTSTLLDYYNRRTEAAA